MSPNENPLRASDLTAYTLAGMAETASERARLRIREEMARRHLSQRDVAGILEWSQSRVSKNLNARIELGLDDLAALAFAVGLSLVEVVRDHGLEFCADMTPTEFRLLQVVRKLPTNVRDGLLGFMEVKAPEVERRHASPIKSPNKLHKGRALSRDSVSQKAAR